MRQKCKKDRERSGDRVHKPKKRGNWRVKGISVCWKQRGWVGPTEMEVEHGREVSPERKQNGAFWKAGKSRQMFLDFSSRFLPQTAGN